MDNHRSIIQQPEDLPHVIFSILSSCRLFPGFSPYFLRRCFYQHTSRKMDASHFWIRLCRSLSLLDSADALFPTLLAAPWFALPITEQWRQVLAGWCAAVQDQTTRRRRERLIEKLSFGSTAPELAPADKRELPGLIHLGLWSDNHLTETGISVLLGHLKTAVPESWFMDADCLHVPIPADWQLLWELEEFLQPFAPGCYSLHAAALRLAVQRGDPNRLVEVLEKGLGIKISSLLSAQILGQPIIQLYKGVVLEFSDPDELAQVRKAPSLRKDLDGLLSTRHVLLNRGKAVQTLRKLRRRGMFIFQEDSAEAQPTDIPIKTAFTPGERSSLIAMAAIVERAGLPFSLPFGLREKLERGLPEALLSTAERRAIEAVPSIEQRRPPQAEGILLPPLDHMLETLQEAIRFETPLNIIYQAPERSPERRHITPLLIEKRGQRFYLIAYCHNRRSNRTFRLDRLRLE